jgi:tRNA threonylcarbamoyladenosine biosynthesis protein TsaB
VILLLDTSTPTCRMTLVDNDDRHEYEWEASRILARDLLGFINEKLLRHSKSWSDINAIGIYKGPGSFTGLRIGITVMNTLADAQGIQIVGASGDGWQLDALGRIASGENQKIVLPLYGREANITKPKK